LQKRLLHQSISFNASYENLILLIQMVIFLSNGPGDPEPLSGAIQVAKEIFKK
jgi:carbamoyl-phosphate synthase small subunit